MCRAFDVFKILLTINLVGCLNLLAKDPSLTTTALKKESTTKTHSDSKNLVININSKEEIKAHQPAIVEFYSEKCGACIMFNKTYQKLAQQFPTISFLKIDGTKHNHLSKHYKIKSFPTFLLIGDDIEKPVEVIAGGDHAKISQALQGLLKRYESKKSSVQNITSLAELESLIKTAGKPVVAEYHAEAWCHHCKIFAPLYEELAQQNSGIAIFVKVDDKADGSKAISAKYGIQALPTTLIFVNGDTSKPVATILGANKDGVYNAIQAALSPSSSETKGSAIGNAIIEIKGKQQLQDLLKNSKMPVVIDFHAEAWCFHCKKYRTAFESFPSQYPKLQFAKLDQDLPENKGLPGEYGVKGFPTTIIFENGTPTKTVVGANIPELQAKFKELSTK